MPHTKHSARQEGKLIDRLMRTARACKVAKAAETRQLRLVEWALAQMPEEGNKRKQQEDDNDVVDRCTKQLTTKKRRQGDTRGKGI